MLKKAYYLLFYKLYCFVTPEDSEGWEQWKALLAMCVLQVMILLELIVWIDVFFKNALQFNVSWEFALPAGIIITILNYYALLHNNRWLSYAAEFKKHPKSKSRRLSWFAFMFVLMILGSLVFAFYQMSLVDWSSYR